MEKIIRDGKVAVAVSGGFGAGWSTWNGINPMDAKFNQLFLDGNIEAIEAMSAGLKGDDEYFYTGGAEDVSILWVPVGTKFFIDEYDGNETLVCIDDIDWLEA